LQSTALAGNILSFEWGWKLLCFYIKCKSLNWQTMAIHLFGVCTWYNFNIFIPSYNLCKLLCVTFNIIQT